MVEATELLSKIITKLAEDAAKSIVGKAKDYFIDREYKEQIDIGYAYEDYLNNVYEAYSKSKTILYGDEPRKLSSFFIPVDLELQVFSKPTLYGTVVKSHILQAITEITHGAFQTKVSSKDITDIFKIYNKLIITGIGGMGKTMLMKYFCTSAIENGYKIPIFISLRRFNEATIEDKPFEKQIFEQLSIFGFRLDYKYFEYSLSSDNYLFLFDGYDELSDAKKQGIATRLNDFAKKYPKNNIIVSSRPADELFGWEEFRIFSIRCLDKKQTVSLIWKLDFDYESKKRFIDELTQGLYDQYKSFASVPLLLSILFLTYVTNAQLPETLNDFYEKAFETLCIKHDKMKIGFERVFKSGLTYELFRNIFICFCFVSYFKEMYSFSYRSLVDTLSIVSKGMKIDFDEDAVINDFVQISCMLIREGQEYVFLHRSFQEYFAAVYMAKKPDLEQATLCSSYIDYKKELFSNVPLKKILTIDPFKFYLAQSLEFFVMLQSVEPGRFEKIVLAPKMKIVSDVFRDNNNDLVTTTRMFSVEFDTLFSDNRLEKVDFEYVIELNDVYIVLKSFFSIGVFKSDFTEIENESLKQQLNEDVIIDSFIRFAKELLIIKGLNIEEKNIKRILKEHEFHEDKELQDTLSLFEVYRRELQFIALIIDRYEKITRQKNNNKDFKDLLIDYI